MPSVNGGPSVSAQPNIVTATSPVNAADAAFGQSPPLSSAQVAAGATGSVAIGPSGLAYASDATVLTAPAADALRYTRWRAKVAGVRDGSVSRASLFYIGDSTTNGSGGAGGSGYNAGGRTHNRPSRLAAALTKSYLPAFAHGQIATSNVLPATWAVFDPRFAYGTGWTGGNFNNSLGKTAFFNTTTVRSGTTNAITFTPVGSVDTFEIYYEQFTSQGTWSWAIDGGTATNVNANAAQALGKAVVSAGSPGTHTLEVNRVSGNITICGFRAYDSTTPHIEIVQAGCSGAFASDYNGATFQWDALNAIPNVYQPDLSIVAIGINDWSTGPQPLATYVTSLTNIVKACLVTGDVIGVTQVPTKINTSPSAPLALQQQYVDAAIGVYRSLGCEVIDTWRRFQSQEAALALGLMSDNQHPSGPGYADWAQAEFNKIIGI